ncbi:hypothetical protein G8759_12695 [Spirosoma aureum]|uniref:Uncharacterized protein n=1 Tax=Spirosoma aureum TaxID=2692134 RepID=A0A6G9AMB5_9BACT|nr:hypothetical protein [Spirosoma aureum]QIP13425.1 hypothetical protein G8759_12695 [Spirosoma aureum]
MKHFFIRLIALFSVIGPYQLFGQGFGGTWTGSLVSADNSATALGSTVFLRVSAEKLNGTVRVQSGNKQDEYTLQGTTNGQQSQGTATYPADGTVFQFEAALQSGQLLFAIGLNGTAIRSGIFTRDVAGTSGARKPATSSIASKTDGLNRDPALIGAWRTSSNYGGGITDGGFYGSTSTTLMLNADGTLGDGGSTGYASGSGVSVESSGGGNANLFAQLAAAGAKWFTKGNLVYIRLQVNNQTQDVPASKYYVENGKMLITDLKSGKKTLYYKVN